MGNGVSSNQGNLPSYGKRDVRRAADRKQHDWFQSIKEMNNLFRNFSLRIQDYSDTKSLPQSQSNLHHFDRNGNCINLKQAVAPQHTR